MHPQLQCYISGLYPSWGLRRRGIDGIDDVNFDYPVMVYTVSFIVFPLVSNRHSVGDTSGS